MEVLILNGTPLNSRDNIMSVHRGDGGLNIHCFKHNLGKSLEVLT